MPEKRYLGDGVYAKFDGYHIVLTVEDGETVRQTIFLDPSVLAGLDSFREDVRADS